MEKPITRRGHAFTDYNYIAAVSIAPKTFGFEDEKAATTLCRAMSATIFVSSLFTRAEWGMVRVMPYKAHLALDAAGGFFALAAPWAFGFAKNERARNTFLVMGVAGLVAGFLSQPDEMEDA